ncbi:MAG TPA: FGGY family carbohydrate kinase [Gammaproteobacteria bacterium]|nr:FGGY family carbohydrate kinase [Gammaproteobacteria bacterium]
MWLCIDQGGHSTRAAALDAEGRIVIEESAPLERVVRAPHFVEHDPAALLRSVDRCLEGVVSRLGPRVAELEAVGLATQRSTLLCAAKRGDALTPLISWQDRRGQEDLAQFGSAAERITSITGLRLSPHYGAGKLRWCLQHLEAVRRHRERGDLVAAPLASYLVHHLCEGTPWRVDPVNASRTLLMDMRTASWSPELLALFGLSAAMLPDIAPCRSSYGSVALGKRRVPLTVVTGDQAAALYCLGEPSAGTAFVNIGTGAFVQVATGGEPVVDPGLLSSVVWQDGRGTVYVLEGTVNGAASAVDEVSATLGVRLDPRGSELARAFAAIEHAPLFLNGVSGLGSPDWVADFASRFEGEGGPSERIAATYESVAFLIVRNLERMRRHGQLSSLTVSGGLAQLDWLVQYLADLSGLPASRPAETEATLTGLAYLLSGGRSRRSARPRRFLPGENAVARRRYGAWTKAMEVGLAG